MTPLREDLRTSDHRRAGPLGTHLDTFEVILMEQGYVAATVRDKVRHVADLGRWLARRDLRADDLDMARVGAFERHRRRAVRRGHPETLRQFLAHLRAKGVMCPAPLVHDESALGRVTRAFERYLACERGLSVATQRNYVPVVGQFLAARFGKGDVHLSTLRSPDATRFLLRQLHTVSPGRARLMVTGLRAFLRWAYLQGEVDTDLRTAVPAVADWRLATLPKALPPEDVERLLRHGRRWGSTRDYAILLLMARLGLRGGEVVALTLDDLDWMAGTIVIRGKGGRQDRLPVPYDVGAALAAYLRTERPACATRRVFIRALAPRRGFANTVAICAIVARALAAAGLDPPRKGGHILRHALACSMLRGGASLAEIGEILRHRRPDTTAVYAKVDREALRALAPAWPSAGAR